MSDPQPAFSDNASANRFEYRVGEHVAYADYRRTDKALYIDYVEAPPALRGTGAAGELMQHIVKVALAENREIIPICGYAATWLRRNVS